MDSGSSSTELTPTDQLIGILTSILVSSLFTSLVAMFVFFVFYYFVRRELTTTETFVFSVFCLVVFSVGSVLVYNYGLSQRSQSSN